MSDDEDFYGPKPPPDLVVVEERRETVGPCLPPGFVPKGSDEEEESDNQNEEEDDDESDVIGPVLPGQDSQRGYSAVPEKSSGDDSKPQREEWMTVIPKKVVKRLGFKSVTSFCKKPVVVEDEDQKDEEVTPAAVQKEEKLSEAMNQYTKNKRSSTLLDIHQENLKKKQKGDDDRPQGRKPLEFDPEKDLHIRNFDEKQTKACIEKSKLLNTRFSAGSSKFL